MQFTTRRESGIRNFAVLESLSDEFDDALLPFAGYRICVTLVSEHSLPPIQKGCQPLSPLAFAARRKALSPGLGFGDLGCDRAFPSYLWVGAFYT